MQHVTRISGRDRPDYIEITAAMERAGLDCLCEYRFGQDFGDLVRCIYMAMECERLGLLDVLGPVFNETGQVR